MSDPNESLDEQSGVASSRMNDGLKTCHKIIETYRAMLTEGQDPAEATTNEVEQRGTPES